MFGTKKRRISRRKVLVAAGLAAVLTAGMVTATSGTNAEAAGCTKAPAPSIKAAQAKLNDAGFWTGTADGKAGQLTSQAVLAYQKYMMLPKTGCISQGTVDGILSFQGRVIAPAEAPSTGAVIDQSRQLLFFTRDGVTLIAFNTSTGNQIPWVEGEHSGKAITPNGSYKVNMERDYLHTSSLGLGKMYRPKYFAPGGIAVHGSASIPAYAASHGCVRVSNKAMDLIWSENLFAMGTPVVTLGTPPKR